VKEAYLEVILANRRKKRNRRDQFNRTYPFDGFFFSSVWQDLLSEYQGC
jgi:hypothetical protein